MYRRGGLLLVFDRIPFWALGERPCCLVLLLSRVASLLVAVVHFADIVKIYDVGGNEVLKR